MQSTLAPRSSMQVRPRSVGRMEAMAGRSIAGQRLQNEARDRHQRAGVAGADAGIAPSPLLTRSIATRMDESLLPRSAEAGARPSRRLRSHAAPERARRRSAASRVQLAFDAPARVRPGRRWRSRMRPQRICRAAGTVTCGAVIASHAIEGDRDAHRIAHGAVRLTRRQAMPARSIRPSCRAQRAITGSAAHRIGCAPRAESGVLTRPWS